MRTVRSLFVLAGAVAIAAGCSVVNSYDEVKQPPENAYTSGPRVDAPLAEPDASVDAGVDAGEAVDHALLVVGGVVEVADATTREPVLAVLDPTTGEELGTRESFHVAGIAHDGKRDLWYLFEAPTSFITTPEDIVHLHIRKLDAKTGAWTELSNTVVPTLFFYDSIAVTNARLTFVAHPSGGSAPRMITLDTSDPAAPKQIDDRDLPALPVGMIATPGGAGAGGQLALVNVGRAADGECEAGVCAAKVRRFLVPNSGPPQDLGSFTLGEMTQFGSPSYGSVVCGGGPDELFILPRAGQDPETTDVAIHAVEYLSTTPRPAVELQMKKDVSLLRRAAVDDVNRLVFLVEANADTNLYAVRLDGAHEVTKAPLRHSGQAVYFDPQSQTAFAPFNQGDGHTFSAFRVTAGSTGAVQLKERIAPPDGDWAPPPDLRPILLGIRAPASYSCP